MESWAQEAGGIYSPVLEPLSTAPTGGLQPSQIRMTQSDATEASTRMISCLTLKRTAKPVSEMI